MKAALKLFVLALFASLFTMGFSAFPRAMAQSAPAVVADDDDRMDQDELNTRNRGVLAGEIVGVDYARGTFVLQTPRRGRLVINFSPGTQIVRDNASYGNIVDLVSRAHVSVYASEVNGRLVAQLIRIH